MVNHPWTETSRVTIVCVDDNRDGILGGRIYNGGALEDGALAYGDSENVTGTFAAAYDITVDENSFERNGYTFLGWSVSPDGEVVYQSGQVISFVEGGSMTLYAQWQLEEYEYTVRYMVRVDGEAYAPFQGTLPAGAPQAGSGYFGQVIDEKTLQVPGYLNDGTYVYGFTALEGIVISQGANIVFVYYTYITPEAPVEISDEEVPKADVPQTGDPIPIYVGMTALSGLGLLGLGLKKKDEDTE